jgi:hypothetical protein
MPPILSVNTKKTQQELLQLARELREAAVVGMRKFEEEEMEESQKLVPVDTGELKNSKYIDEPYWDGDRLRGALGYTAPHALTVHENHDAIYRVGQSNYLAQPLDESAPYMVRRIAATIREEVGM